MASSIGRQAPDASAISHKRAEIRREQAEKRHARPCWAFVVLPSGEPARNSECRPFRPLAPSLRPPVSFFVRSSGDCPIIAITMAIAAKSFTGTPHSVSTERQASAGHHPVERADLVRFALVGAAAAASWTGVSPRLDGLEPVSFAAALVGGYPVFREAVDNMAARRMTMELSMTLALTAALAIKEFSTALFILFFVLGAEIDRKGVV